MSDFTGHGGERTEAPATRPQGNEMTMPDPARRPDDEVLLTEREFSSAVLDTVGALVVVLDRQGRIVRVNRAFEQATGYAARELTGRSPWELLLVPEEAEWVRGVFRDLLAGRYPSTYESQWVAKDETHRLIAWSNTVLLGDDGSVEYVVGTGIDITRRRQAEEERERLLEEQVRARRKIEELAETAQRRAAELQSILDNMVEAVFVCGVDGQFTLANGPALRLLGMASLAEVRDALPEFPRLLRPRHSDGTPITLKDMALVHALSGKTTVAEEQIIWSQQAGREVHLRVSAAPIRDEKAGIVGAVAVVRDVTELTELDRLKDQFISVAAHELKTPVAIMKGYAQTLLRTAGDLSPAHRRMLDAVDRGAGRIDRIVRDLLDVSRLNLGHLELSTERIDLPEFAQQVVDRMALTTGRHRARVVSAEPAIVEGDRDRLEQVLANLIDNAIRYSPGGGDVDVAVAVRDGQAVVSVRDHGVGIPSGKQARIFERFYRAHTGTPYDYGGMGIGLYISREIVARHGGRTWFESQEGQGSTFHFSLPVSAKPAGPRNSAHSRRPSEDGG